MRRRAPPPLSARTHENKPGRDALRVPVKNAELGLGFFLSVALVRRSAAEIDGAVNDCLTRKEIQPELELDLTIALRERMKAVVPEQMHQRDEVFFERSDVAQPELLAVHLELGGRR